MVSKLTLTQNNFAYGQIDPLLFSATDNEFYFKSASKLENVLITPQANITRRFGTLFGAEFLASPDIYNARQFNYSEEQNYLVLFLTDEIRIIKDNVIIYTIVTSIYTADKIKQIKFSNSQNLLIITHPDIAPYQLKRGATDTDWTFEEFQFKNYPAWDFRQDYNAITFSMPNVSVGSGRNLNASSAIFVPEHVGGVFSGLGADLTAAQGVGRITAYNSPTQVVITIISAFNDSFRTGVSGKNCYLAEPIFSAARGYPVCSTFHDSRLLFGGAKSLSDSISFSKVNDFYNFDDTTGKTEDGTTIRIATAEFESIQNLLSNKTLQIFTLTGEFSTTETIGTGFALGTFTIRKQSSKGSNTLQPVIYENAAIFILNKGKAVYGIVPADEQNGYITIKLSNFITSKLNNPISMAVRRSSAEDDIDLLLIVNDDGSLLIFQMLSQEKISAWTLNLTDGKFRQVVPVGGDIYFIVQRNIDGGIKNHIEKLSFDVFTDCSKIVNTGTPLTEVSGLTYLDNKTVAIIADGYVIDEQIVSDGKITLETPATEIKIGLPVIPIVETVPINLPPSIGDSTYRYKRINLVWVDYFESNGIIVNGYKIPDYHFDGELPIKKLEPKTDIAKVLLQDGQTLQPIITLTQEHQLPFTIKALGYELEVQ